MIEGEGRTCFNCRWNNGSWPAGENRTCVSPHLAPRNVLVEGRANIRPSRCDYQRSRLWRWLGLDTCGLEGRYYRRP